MHEAAKSVARFFAFVLVLPSLLSYHLKKHVIGPDRALEGSTQLLAPAPGLIGQYLRRAFLSRAIAGCHPTAAICFGTLFSQSGARIDQNVYVGPNSHLGLVHIERDALLGAGVHVTSGRHTHGTGDAGAPIRSQGGARSLVRIGAGAWIGSAAVVMADVGRNTVVGAGSVVTRPLPDNVVAAGVPARVIRSRTEPSEDERPISRGSASVA